MENLVLTQYMLNTWWLLLLDGLGHYIIHQGEIEQVLGMTNNIITLGYTYDKFRLNNPPEVFYKIIHNGRVISWIPSRLAWNPAL